MSFRDREEAGLALAARLEAYRIERPVVLALPRGGVPVGFEVARALGAALDLVLVRKIGAPSCREFALGAVAEGGGVYLNAAAVVEAGSGEDDVAALAERELPELERQARVYRGAAPQLGLEGRTVILVDDGVATGATARAAARAARRRGAARLVVAAPVIPEDAEEALRAEVDAVVAVERPRDFFAISQWYARFDQISDDDVLRLLRRAQAARAPASGGADAWGGDWLEAPPAPRPRRPPDESSAAAQAGERHPQPPRAGAPETSIPR